MPSSHLSPLNPPKHPNHNHYLSGLSESGQSSVLLALMFMMLLAFVGLATDTGILYVAYGQLRRAVDSAALGAATQVREAVKTQDQVTDMARQYIQLQGFEATSITVETCGWIFPDPVDPTLGRLPQEQDVNLDANGRFLSFKQDAPTDTVSLPSGSNKHFADYPTLCTYPVTKKVRVEASAEVQTAFLHIVGWNSFTLRASAVTEAASLEIVLILDTSYSMTYDSAIDNDKDDDGDNCADETTTTPGHIAGTATPCSDGNGKDDNWLRGIFDTGSVKYEPECNWHVPGDSGDSDVGAITQILSKLPPYYYYPTDSTNINDRMVPGHSCLPFEYVRNSAIKFVSTYVNFPYDRVSIVTFSNLVTKVQGINTQGVSDSRTETLNHLRAYDTRTGSGGSRIPDSTTPLGEKRLDVSASPDCTIADWKSRPGYCEATNTGGALAEALTILNDARQNSLRFIILVSDGAATTSPAGVASKVLPANGGYACPYTWKDDATGDLTEFATEAKYDPYFKRRNCTDGTVDTKYASNDTRYDADDYARDKAFAIGNSGKNVIIFTIGLGNAVTENPGVGTIAKPQPKCSDGQLTTLTTIAEYSLCNNDQLPNGEQLLRYIADQGDGTKNLGSDPCGRNDVGTTIGLRYNYTIAASCGNYYYAQGGLDLEKVFEAIASRIFTRVTQ